MADVIAQAREKVVAAEKGLAKCQESEMPFLRGIEILPPDESAKALGESEASSKEADEALLQAEAFVRTKLTEAKRKAGPNDDTGDVGELKRLQQRVEAASTKVQAFKKETHERKIAAMLAEVVESVALTEKRIKELGEAAKVFDHPERVSLKDLKAAVEKSTAGEKAASTSFAEAGKLIAKKRNEMKAPDAQQAIGKLQNRLNAAQKDLSKQRSTAQNGTKAVNDKVLIDEEEAKIKEAEGQIKKAEKLASGKPDDEQIQQIETLSVEAIRLLTSGAKDVEQHMRSGLPTTKSALQKLATRSKQAQEKLDAVKAATKERREQVLSEAYVKEATEKTEEVESGMEKVNEAELPFLKGIEVLPLKEAKDTIAASEEAATDVNTAIAQARNFIAAKSVEIKKFDQAVSKSAIEELGSLTDRINASAQKLGQFRKDTEDRKRTKNMQEAGEKVTAMEEQVQKAVEASAPFAAENAKELSEDEANEACEKLLECEKAAQALLSEARSFLAARLRDSKAHPAHGETLSKLQARLSSASGELVRVRKLGGEHEQKLTAKKLVEEVNSKIAQMTADGEQLVQDCSPLLEKGGEEFLVAASVQAVATGLRSLMKEKELTEDSLYVEVNGGQDKSQISKTQFLEYLAKLPEAISNDECAFTAERRQEMFTNVDADGDGEISREEFKNMFRKRFICRTSITITDGFEIAKSKSTGKVEVSEILEAVGEPMIDEAGMERIECKFVSQGKQGWVTSKGNRGTLYLEEYSPFAAFGQELDKKFEVATKSASKVAEFVGKKTTEFSKSPPGPLADAMGEVNKLRPKVAKATKDIETLKRRVAQAKQDYVRREEAERMARIEAKEQKEADAITGVAAEKVEATKAKTKLLEEAAAPLISLEGADLDAFATPLSVMDETDKLIETVQGTIGEAKAVIQEQQTKIPKAGRGPMAKAKVTLMSLMQQTDAAAKRCGAIRQTVCGACEAITFSKHSEASAALRSEVQKNGLTLDKMFKELANGKGCIPEDAFCKRIGKLEGLSFPPEHLQLLVRRIEAGGIGRRSFQRFLQLFFLVVRDIAITHDFDVGKSKIIRKAEINEIIEVLEGPQTDEKLGLIRVKGKSLADGAVGWISVKGNRGTPFLQEIEKPFYTNSKELRLEENFVTDPDELVRMLEVGEIVELIEGPRNEKVESTLRIKGKTCPDGQVGWITTKDRNGVVFAEPSDEFYICTTSVAMTDDRDIKSCKVIRKLWVDEIFKRIEGPFEEQDAGITRLKARTLKDDKVGWITTKGNAGTVYAVESSKHYAVLREVSLQSSPGDGAETSRTLKKDDGIELLDGPKEETPKPAVRCKVRAESDGKVGWITLTEAVRNLAPYYRCKKATDMQEARATKDATVVRKIAANETVELLEGPVQDESKELRMKGRAEKDGATGWVTIKDAEGTVFLDSVEC